MKKVKYKNKESGELEEFNIDDNDYLMFNVLLDLMQQIKLLRLSNGR